MNTIPIPNTFGLNCVATQEIAGDSIATLQDATRRAANASLPLLVVGSGSNVLFLESSLDACVIYPRLTHYHLVEESESSANVTVGAGYQWHSLVLRTLQDAWDGLENLALIPGSAGAAPVQNIGAYGVELKDILISVNAVEFASGEIHLFKTSELAFGYRDSFFKGDGKGRFVIAEISLRLTRGQPLNVSYDALNHILGKLSPDKLCAQDVANAVIAVRRSKLPDPSVLGNAGSFFKNPVVDVSVFERLLAIHPCIPSYPLDGGRVKLAAGWLIEKAGLKGMVRGKAGTHAQQALVIVNHGGATGREIYDVAREVRDTVAATFDVLLEPEVRIVNRYAEDVVL